MSDKTLAEAFVAAQAEFPAVEPDAVNPHFKSKFVSLGHLLAKVRPVLNKHGLSVIQFPTLTKAGHPTLMTTIMHESGEVIEAEAPLLLPKQDPQGQGSAITYMRRYALASALGISDQEDDDGNAGVKAREDEDTERIQRAIDLERRDALGKFIKDSGIGFDKLCTIMSAVGADAPKDKTAKAVREALGALTEAQAEHIHASVEGHSGS